MKTPGVVHAGIGWWFFGCVVLMAGAVWATDLDEDGKVNLSDFFILSGEWLSLSCTEPENCSGCDSEPDGDVDLDDLLVFIQDWLKPPDNQYEYTVKFVSIGAEDGRIWDEDHSDVGVDMNATDSSYEALRLGDYYVDEHVYGYKMVLSFDTSLIPENAEIEWAELELNWYNFWNLNPFDWGGNCNIYITDFFGTSPELELLDWSAAYDVLAGYLHFSWYNPLPCDSFSPEALDIINTQGRTQLRIEFDTISNYNTLRDYMGFYSGDGVEELRPKLCVRFLATPPEFYFSSYAGHDGRVWDTDGGGVGINNNSTASGPEALRLGDFDTFSYRTILSFDTSEIPTDAVIESAHLELTRGVLEGTNPFTWGGQCQIDIDNPFGDVLSLENNDWEDSATETNIAQFTGDPGSEQIMVSSDLSAAGLAAINRSGYTQFRVYFENSGNENGLVDYLGFYSGEDDDSGKNPKLYLVYYVP
ncbi:MAG: hypothetical protein JW860_04160 [Sedimentisphaerales bacterium]|nr:hypothetical protein [Sedimentisphaerales bacterium]